MIERIFAKNNNTWNIRNLVNEKIVPSTQRIILKIVGFVDNRADTVLDILLR